MIGVGKLGQDCAEVMAQHYDVAGYDINLVEPTATVAIKSSIKNDWSPALRCSETTHSQGNTFPFRETRSKDGNRK